MLNRWHVGGVSLVWYGDIVFTALEDLHCGRSGWEGRTSVLALRRQFMEFTEVSVTRRCWQRIVSAPQMHDKCRACAEVHRWCGCCILDAPILISRCLTVSCSQFTPEFSHRISKPSLSFHGHTPGSKAAAAAPNPGHNAICLGPLPTSPWSWSKAFQLKGQ